MFYCVLKTGDHFQILKKKKKKKNSQPYKSKHKQASGAAQSLNSVSQLQIEVLSINQLFLKGKYKQLRTDFFKKNNKMLKNDLQK